MSLLMDALKKAEQEKKEAAKRLKEAQEKSGEHYKLEDSTAPDSVARADDNEAKEIEEPVSTPAFELEDSSFRQEDGTEESEILSQEEEVRDDESSLETESAPEPTIAEPVELSLSDSADDTLQNAEINEDDETDFDDDIAPDENDQTFALSSMSLEEESSVPFDDTSHQDIIDDTRSETISDSRISKSFVSAEVLARDMGTGREVPTPVAAQTVFSAVARSNERRQFLEWMLFLGLVTIIIMATGAFYYLKVTPLTPETSSPLVAKGVEVDTNNSLDINIPNEVTEPVVTGEVSKDEPLPDTAVDESAITESLSVSPVTARAEEATAMQPADDTAPEKETTDTGQPDSSGMQTTDNVSEPAPFNETLPSSLPEQIPLDQTAIAISRGRSVSEQSQLIHSAYASYIAGDLNRAESEYNQVLASQPGNRDALLGLAAISYRRGNAQAAFEFYLKVLKLFPRDTVARSAIINLQGETDPVRSESLLKLMIADSPQAAYLYFTLGNVYANIDRWADAQQAFFEAYRLQSVNPDYAYNLAVSLDQLGQRNAARDYYKTALELADTRQTSFSTVAVIGRINSLSPLPDK